MGECMVGLASSGVFKCTHTVVNPYFTSVQLVKTGNSAAGNADRAVRHETYATHGLASTNHATTRHRLSMCGAYHT